MPDLAARRVRLVAEAADAATEVILIDHKLSLVTSSVGRLEGDFTPGLYKIRVAVGGLFDEQLVELPSGQETVHFKARPVRLDSAAPLDGEAPAAHQEGAVKCSREKPLSSSFGTGSEIFLFVRDPEGTEGAEPWRDVSIRTPADSSVLDLETLGVHSASDGFAGATVKVAPGSYVLCVDTRAWGIQQMPLVASPGWQTQVFLSTRTMERKASGAKPAAPAEWGSRRADLFTASVFMARMPRSLEKRKELDLSRPSARLVEVTRLALERGRDILRSGELREILRGELEDPMLGLLAGHILLLAEKPDLILLRTVLDKLRAMGLAEHLDLRALDLALQPASERFANPPMLRSGWRQVVQATASQQDLIPPDSWAFHMAPRVIGSSAWLVWHPPGEGKKKWQNRNVRRGGHSSRGRHESLEQGLSSITKRLDHPRSVSFSTSGLPDEALSAPAQRNVGPRLGFLERTLLQAIESSVEASGGRPPEVEELVQALGLPAANIGELLKQVVRKRGL